MIVICLVVSGWWYAYLYIYQYNAVDAVIHKESGAWTGHNVRSWYYYWRFFTETGIWAVLMLATLALPYWKRHLTSGTYPPSPCTTYLFSITWALAALILLSLMPELHHVPFYHPADDNFRIEIVYEAGKKNLPLNVKDSAQVISHLPFALVTHKSASRDMQKNILQQVDTVSLGTFDDNKHPKKDRHYTQDFVYHIIIINKKHE